MSYVRVSILGSMTGGEVWSINPVFDPTGEFPGGVDQNALDTAAAAIAALNPGGTLLGWLTTAASVTGARLEVRDDNSDGLIAISTQQRGTALPGTGSPTKPAQIAGVFSIRTNTPGASGRGRVYWPAMGSSMGSDFRLNSPAVSTALAEFKTYMLAVRSALAAAFPTIGFDLAVRSKAQQATPHAVRIQVGNVLDTQRRRRDNLPESYVQVAFP